MTGFDIRLFTNQPLAAGADVVLDGGRCHYLRNVMRRRPGDNVALFNGIDGEWQAVIATLERREGSLSIVTQLRVQIAEVGPTLLFAPLRRARLEMLVEKAVELGATRLEPTLTRYSQPGRIKGERLAAIAVEAAEQSRRLSVPVIDEPCDLSVRLAVRDGARPLYVGDETGMGRPAIDAFSANGPGDLLIGPEGGFSDDELALLIARADVVPIDLGPRILRAETAAIAALACWQAVLGEGGR